jgi:hypothetical protein
MRDIDSESRLSFHPDAAEKFRERGQALLASVRPLPERTAKTGFQPEVHPTAVLDVDISQLGPLHTLNSLTGEVSEIAFVGRDGMVVGLVRTECDEVAKLAEAIQRTAGFKSWISDAFVRGALLSWLQESVRGEVSQDLPEYILERARSAIHLIEVWVPLANLALESEIRLEPVRVRPITKETVDGWFAMVREATKQDSLARLEQILEAERAKIQGLSAAYIALRAERQFAVDKAIERAEEVAAFFRLLHPANSEPRAAFYCRALGREPLDSYSVIVVEDGIFQGRSAQAVPPDPALWAISNEQLGLLEETFCHIRGLSVGVRTDFQKDALDAILLYTRSTMAAKPTDKLVFIFSALESILLKNENEPIQTHISDRLAFVLGRSTEERREIVRVVRKCYGLRSTFLHHGGTTLDDYGTLALFMRYVWVFFMRLPQFSHQHETRFAFIEAIETRKYSGP